MQAILELIYGEKGRKTSKTQFFLENEGFFGQMVAYFKWTNFRETYFRESRKRHIFASFISRFRPFLLFFTYLMHFYAFFVGLAWF